MRMEGKLKSEGNSLVYIYVVFWDRDLRKAVYGYRSRNMSPGTY